MHLRALMMTPLIMIVVLGSCNTKKEEHQFQVIEATIKDIHQAFRENRLTAEELVEIYLQRIEKYDKSTLLNSITAINSHARARAKELDEEFQQTGELRPLHGICLVIKDNIETKDMPTTAGSEALKDFIPPDDAYIIKKLREAGAIILAKSNMAEWAFSPYITQSGTAGITRNPYDLNRVPAGSSGGTAAAVAANLVTIGLGTDTGNSVRGPSSHCCLVGLRPTLGLVSRDGIIPLYLRNDTAGPMGRTVEDVARILDIIAGYDPSDPLTKMSEGEKPPSYLKFLDKNGLKGARVGVFRLYTDLPTVDPQVVTLFNQAIEDMKRNGAIIVDPFVIPNFGELTKNLWCDTFRHDLNQYLRSLGERAPVKNLLEVYNKGLFSLYIRDRLVRALDQPPDKLPCQDIYHEPRNIAFRQAVLEAMAKQGVDFIVYPTWSNPPRKLGDLRSPAGDNSQLLSPHTGFPAITIPMGFTYKNLPAGLQIVGKLFSEPQLLKVAYAYEQATHHRRPPHKFD